MRAPIDVVHEFTTGFLGQGDEAVADRTLHADVRGITGLKPTAPIEGREEYKAIFRSFAAAFEGVTPLAITDQFAAGERVVTRFRITARHVGDYFGMAPTGRVILLDEMHVARVVDGLIVENIVSATNLEFEMLMAPVLAPMILGAAQQEAAGHA